MEPFAMIKFAAVMIIPQSCSKTVHATCVSVELRMLTVPFTESTAPFGSRMPFVVMVAVWFTIVQSELPGGSWQSEARSFDCRRPSESDQAKPAEPSAAAPHAAAATAAAPTFCSATVACSMSMGGLPRRSSGR